MPSIPNLVLSPRLLTGLSWLVLGLGLALLYVSWDPYTLRTWFNADNLQMIGFFYDMAVHHYPITDQSLSQAMYWFPDVLVQAVMAALSGFNPAVTLIGGGWVMGLTTIWLGHACLQRLIPHDTPTNKRYQITLLLNALISLSFVGLLLSLSLYRWSDGDLVYLWFPHMLLWPCFHNGVILMTLLALWLSLTRFNPSFDTRPFWTRCLVITGYISLILVGLLSDRLLLLTWVLPLTLVMVGKGFKGTNRHWLAWTWAAVGLAIVMILVWQSLGNFTGLSITWDWPDVALQHWLIVAQTAPLCIWVGVALAILTGAGLFSVKLYRWVGFAWVISLLSTLIFVIVTQMMQDYQAFRYLLPFMGLSLWVMAWAAAWQLSRLSWTPLTSRSLTAVTLIGVVYLSVVFVASSRLMQVLHFTPPFTACFNDLGPSFDHSTGLAEYWVDRPNELFTTRRNLTLLTVYEDGKPRHWLNNAQEWHDPQHPEQSPPIRFVVMKGLNPADVQATWGAPDEVITCRQWPDIHFWVFSPPRRYANPLAKP